jgi:hypothetical protein
MEVANHLITSSLHHLITSSPHHFITSSPHPLIPSSLHHFITSSTHQLISCNKRHLRSRSHNGPFERKLRVTDDHRFHHFISRRDPEQVTEGFALIDGGTDQPDGCGSETQ